MNFLGALLPFLKRAVCAKAYIHCCRSTARVQSMQCSAGTTKFEWVKRGTLGLPGFGSGAPLQCDLWVLCCAAECRHEAGIFAWHDRVAVMASRILQR